MFIFAVLWGPFLGILVCLPVARPITVRKSLEPSYEGMKEGGLIEKDG
jgi:hypothetical protein